ncbi:MAG: hypothetical protein E7434_00560 [Ruminococcaceae bacterium]|nr:hypothetical protein [Oscillospiraceae bacterium]
MKRILIILLTLIMLVGCNEELKPTDHDFLINGDWKGFDSDCSYAISFSENESVKISCECGDHIKESALVSKFSYQKSDHMIKLYDKHDKLLESGSILYSDHSYLIIEMWDNVFVYENQNAALTMPNEAAQHHFENYHKVLPELTILEHADDKLTVSASDYDADAADQYEVWELPLSDEVEYLSISVTSDSESSIVDVSALSDDDIAYIGDFYNIAYLAISAEGRVTSVIFYGEVISE